MSTEGGYSHCSMRLKRCHHDLPSPAGWVGWVEPFEATAGAAELLVAAEMR